MIIVKFSGGIGNQLFQYALYDMLKKKYPEQDVKADLSDYVLNDVHSGFELDRVFGLIGDGRIRFSSIGDYWRCRRELPVRVGGTLGKKLEVFIAWSNARTRKLAARNPRIEWIEEEPFHMHLSSKEKEARRQECQRLLVSLEKCKDYYIDGYWQDSIYYPDGLKTIAETLRYKRLRNHPEIIEMAAGLSKTNSVSVHLRCGDYLNSDYDVLTDDYYKTAIEHLKDLKSIERIVVFSDDTQKARERFAWMEKAEFIDGHSGEEAWIDLYLMSKCKHHVIANSSFSTWAAFLAEDKAGVVIYPDWYTKEDSNYQRDGWIRVKCGD